MFVRGHQFPRGPRWGAAYGDALGEEGTVRDERRIAFCRAYLSAVVRAIREGAPIRACHAGPLLDNFEWSEGFAQRVGVVYSDLAAGKRAVKESGSW